MSSSSAYSLQLPYLGSIPLGRSPPNLSSFQKPLRELYIPYYRQRRERYHDERRIIISDRDILIFEPDAASKGKRSLIYSALESIVDIQALELYIMFNHSENHHHKRIRAAFLPIGCEHQERFRPLYSTIDKSQYHLLSTPASSSSCHPPLVLFAIRKTGAGGTCSLIDCHVFAVRRESVAFELCDMMRKLVMKRTMSPALPGSAVATATNGTTLLRIHDNEKETTVERRTKYLNRDRPVSAMEHRQADIQLGTDKKNNRSTSSMHLNDILQSTSNGLSNPLTSSTFLLTNHQQSNGHHDPSQVLNNDRDNHRLSSNCSTPIRTLSTKHQQQRHFIKASSSSSSLMIDESDEVVNDLMNIVVAEKLKTIDTNASQASVKRHASFDQTSFSSGHSDHTTNKKRYQFHHNNKKRSLLINSNPLPTIISANNTPVISRTTTNIDHQQQQQPSSSSVILESHLLRPQIVLNRYGDIGNYVPKLLRENVTTTSTTMRSSDSNENIFFRATNGHILNGFLNLDFSSTTKPGTQGGSNNNNNHAHYRSTPCLNEDNHDRNVLSLVQQLRRNQSKSFTNESDSSLSNQVFHIEQMDDDHRVPTCPIPRVIFQSQAIKPAPAAMGGIKVLPLTPATSYATQCLLRSSCSSSAAKPRRVASFTIADTELPIDYRQYLRHTDQGAHLYGEEQQRQQQQQSTTLEHSLGYFP